MNDRVEIEDLVVGLQDRLFVDPTARSNAERKMLQAFDVLTQSSAQQGVPEILSIVEEAPSPEPRANYRLLLLAACLVLATGIAGAAVFGSRDSRQLTIASSVASLPATTEPVLLNPGTYRTELIGGDISFTIEETTWLDVLEPGYATFRQPSSNRTLELMESPRLALPVSLGADEQAQDGEWRADVANWIEASSALNVQRSAAPTNADLEPVQVWTILVTPTVTCPDDCQFGTTRSGRVIELTNAERNVIMQATLSTGENIYGVHSGQQAAQADLAVPFLDLMASIRYGD